MDLSHDPLWTRCQSLGAELRILGTDEHSLPIWAATRRGDPDRAPILITAGSHADETSGPEAAVRLLAGLPTTRTVVAIPNRDPLGALGVPGAVRTLVDANVPNFSDWGDVRRWLAERDALLAEDGSFAIGIVGDFALAGMDATGDSFGTEKIIKSLSYWLETHPEDRAALDGRWILMPANAPDCDRRGTLEHGYSIRFTDDDFVGHYNRFFGHPDAPAGVAAVRAFIDELRPGLTIDLHEGWNTRSYWFVPDANAPHAAEAAQLEAQVCAALDANGLAMSTLSELVPNMPLEHLRRFTPKSHGRLVWSWPPYRESPWGVALMPYAAQYGPAFQTEVGRWNSWDDRLTYQRVLAESLVRASEQTASRI
jgi:predicted deacylase